MTRAGLTKTASRSLDRLLKVVVLQVEQTNNKAYVFTVGLTDGKSVTVVGKTDAQRRITAEQGELITIHIDGISQRDGKFGLVSPTPVRSASAIAAPNSMADLAKMFEAGK